MTDPTLQTLPAPQTGLTPPWSVLPAGLADVLRPEAWAVAQEILAQLGTETSALGAPAEGGLDGSLAEQLVHRLVDLIETPADPRAPACDGQRCAGGAAPCGPACADAGALCAAGRLDQRAGRTPEAVRRDYRIAARVCWRRFADAARRAGLDVETVHALAEAVFVYFDGLAVHGLRGYAQARDRDGDSLDRRRRRLLSALLAEQPGVASESLARLAGEAQWRLPRTVAVIALDARWGETHAVSPLVGTDVLMDLDRRDPCLVVPDADGPGRFEALRRAFDGTALVAMGPSVPLAEVPLSLVLARQAIGLARRGVLPASELIRCDLHLHTLMIFGAEGIVRLLTRQRFAPLAGLKPMQRQRLTETLLIWLSTGGSAPDLADRLHVHPQTVRYRLHRIQKLFGDLLRDPVWRFQMEIVLYAEALAARQAEPVEGAGRMLGPAAQAPARRRGGRPAPGPSDRLRA
ncbi:PucR family transcriptional regulator [Actinomadura scrupuli]|uniref:PucR family transcriptional regulator n=1 Tax=Actinomadura scrupuli TaxID=559629 RepID=UPI003D97CAB3